MTENQGGNGLERLRSGGRRHAELDDTTVPANKPSRRLRVMRRTTVIGVALGVTSATAVAIAATNWVVGVNANSSATAQGAGIQPLTVSKITSGPTLTNKLYPGGTGDVTFTISNPNPYPVLVTGITPPSSTTSSNDAVGYSNAGLSTGVSGCDAGTSTVQWKSPGTAVSFGTAFTVGTGAQNQVTVTLTNDATMDASAPLACAGTPTGTAPNLTYPGVYFQMQSLSNVTASAGGTGLPTYQSTVTTSY